MQKLEIKVNKKDRIDKIIYVELLNKGFNVSRSKVVDMLPHIVLFPKLVKPSVKVGIGETVIIDLDAVDAFLNELLERKSRESNIIAQKGVLDIVAETDNFIVVNKPVNLVVHPGVGVYQDTLANYVKYYFLQKGLDVESLDRVGIVHRLDKGTSGLLVIAKTWEMQKWLIKQFESHQVFKLYKMKVNSVPNKFPIHSNCSKEALIPQVDLESWCNPSESDWVKVEGVIMRDKYNRKRMRFHTGEGYGYSKGYAKTLFYFCSDNTAYARICTGRTHQIRASLKYLNISIINDSLYSNGRGHNPDQLALTSVYLKFRDLENNWCEFALDI